MKSRQIILIGAALVIVSAMFLYKLLSSQKKSADRTPVLTILKMVKSQSVKNTDLASQIEITGRLAAKHKIEIFAEVSGLFKAGARPFKEGSYFKKGQTIIKIDDEEHQINLLAQKSSMMNQITLMLADLKTDYPDAYPRWKNYLDSLDIEQPLQELPKPVSEQDKYYVSARNIYNLFYNIQALEARSSKYRIIAPYDGVVAASNINEGTLVRIGQKMGEFMNSYSYEMEAAVNMKELDFIRSGNTVDLYSHDIEGNWKGKIIRISDRIDPNTQTVKVFIATSGKGLKEGMYLTAKVQGKSIEHVVEISRDLLIDNSKVYIVKDSSLNLQAVEPILFTSQTVFVKGLKDGATLLTETIIGAFEGMKVGIIQE